MKRSTDRILTTHAGSLPRPADILEKLAAKQQAAFDEPGMADRLRGAVADIVRKQVELGVDVVDDGEQGKVGFIPYINERLTGYEIDKDYKSLPNPWSASKEGKSFPEFYAPGHYSAGPPRMVCTGPISYKGQAQVKRDIDNLKAALKGVKTEESFLPSVSPTSVADWQRNAHYKNYEEYLFAVASAMHEEYKAITDAGFLVQIDDPHLVTQWITEPYETIDQCRKAAQMQVAALNHALKGIPPEMVRHHTCYGINIGPRVHDLELDKIVDIILTINAQAYSFEASNPRHEHEWIVWETTKLPDGKILIPGVISHSTVVVEHPELVAQRIARFAGVVGRENVIAGSDCGFATFAASKEIHPTIVWAKFQALSDGARIASKQLWRR
jgi:5-methyltetrahydropteroyltriglutamate--homocysteine methyltransferase